MLARWVDGTNNCYRLKQFFAKNFARNYEKKNNTWNIRRMVDEFNQQISETVETKSQTKCMAGMLLYFMKAILCSLDTQSRDAMVFGYFTVKPSFWLLQ